MEAPVLDAQALAEQQRRETARLSTQQANANPFDMRGKKRAFNMLVGAAVTKHQKRSQAAHGIKQKGLENKFNEEQGEAMTKEAERLIGNATMLMPKMQSRVKLERILT